MCESHARPEYGLHDEAAEAVLQITALDACYGDHVVADLQSRNLHPGLIRLVVDGLRRAGLEGRDLRVSRAATA